MAQEISRFSTEIRRQPLKKKKKQKQTDDVQERKYVSTPSKFLHYRTINLRKAKGFMAES